MVDTPPSATDLDFDGFRRLAQDRSISKYERIGFPDAYRFGFESAIFADIRRKLTALDAGASRVIDIGPGCSDLPVMLIDHCRTQRHQLTLVDSAEMLAHLPDAPFIEKTAARFPDCPELLASRRSSAAAVLAYSVTQYVFSDASVFAFLDACLSLLAPGGQLLLGDIPNVSKRKRFFASETGARFHQAFLGTSESPVVGFNTPEPGKIDDSVVLALLSRARSAGFDAYVVPQAPELPMANRREDLLFVRP